MSNIHGLFSGKKDDSEEEGDSNRRFVGGIDSRGGGSGLAVEPSFEDGASGAAPRDSVFSMAENAESGEEVRRTITMYRDGFVVDDGPYRRLDDPENAEFLRSLARGVTPRELAAEGNVAVGLVDKRDQDYKETFHSFVGEGSSLGTASSPTDSTDVIDPSSLPEQTLPIVDGEPTTSIQVRTLNGQRQIIRINTSRTVMDLAAHLRGAANSRQFRLLSGFPPKPISDFAQTVEAAGLKGGSVTMQAS